MYSLNDNNEKIINSILYMHEGEPICDFIKDSELLIESSGDIFKSTYLFTFTTSPEIYKKYKSNHGAFIVLIKNILHDYHQYNSVIVNLTANWGKLNYSYAEVKPILTNWDEVNSMQHTLIEQVHSASTTISFQNIGNTSRHLLKKLSDIVFEENKHTPTDNTRDLSPECFKNRLWAFVLYKFSDSGTNEDVRNYAVSLLDSTDKAINLSNTTTHALNADNFLGQSCAISTITTVHLIKLAFDKQDPI